MYRLSITSEVLLYLFVGDCRENTVVWILRLNGSGKSWIRNSKSEKEDILTNLTSIKRRNFN